MNMGSLFCCSSSSPAAVLQRALADQVHLEDERRVIRKYKSYRRPVYSTSYQILSNLEYAVGRT